MRRFGAYTTNYSTPIHNTCINFFVVHDGINSLADYNSLRVSVGWMSDVGWMDVRGKFHDWITSERLKILS